MRDYLTVMFLVQMMALFPDHSRFLWATQPHLRTWCKWKKVRNFKFEVISRRIYRWRIMTTVKPSGHHHSYGYGRHSLELPFIVTS
jgi:hypothetical protein